MANVPLQKEPRLALDYKQAGVDVVAGERLVDWLKSTSPANSPHQDKLVGGIGGFAALFRADFKAMSEPCLVSCTDGVGTKLKLAVHFKSYREVAQDLVAMCVNDLVCSGAEPLFFLDYYASGKLDVDNAKEFLGGVRDACVASGCALIGGETAEMPGVYRGEDFDCAGFAVGVVDRPRALGPHRVRAGQRLLGIASSGFHSNGFSLLRRVFERDLDDWRDVLLKPTALYPKLVRAAINHGGVNAIAHVTGGGVDNVPRALPGDHRAVLNAWPVAPEFHEVMARTGLTWNEMLLTLNCGLGMVWVCDADKINALRELAEREGHRAFDVGRVEAAPGEASWTLADQNWRGQNS